MKRTPLLLLCAALVVVGLWWRMREPAWPIANSPPTHPGIVCFGDSLTTGLGLSDGEAYPAQLARLLGLPPEQVTALGTDGLRLLDAPQRLGALRATNAGTVVIVLGGNDQLRVSDPERPLAALKEIARALIAEGRMVAIADFSPLTGVHASWARGFRRVARETGALLIPGAADGLYTTDHQYTQSDGAHLNAEGQRALAERLASALGPALGR
jgi:lysophospholipase L1-like esterase